VLTYDDGPGPRLAAPLLALLREFDAKASFFLVGFRAERFPETVAELAAAGHEIGNHSHWHRHAWRTLAAPWRCVRDMHLGRQTLARWTGPAAPYRPPFGKLTLWTALAASRAKSPLCFWTHDGADTWTHLPDPRMIAQQIADDGGGVVLLHSHDRGDERQAYVLAITRRLLEIARERGLRVCTMAELNPKPDTVA